MNIKEHTFIPKEHRLRPVKKDKIRPDKHEFWPHQDNLKTDEYKLRPDTNGWRPNQNKLNPGKNKLRTDLNEPRLTVNK